MSKRKLLFLWVSLFLCSCSYPQQPTETEFETPQRTVKLPKSLIEASGLAIYSSEELLLINDEEGIIFFFHLKDEKIGRTLNFNLKGDFEGVEVVGDDIYVLESKGVLHKIDSTGKVTSLKLFKKGYDLEGICLHPDGKRLLIACKQHANEEQDESIWVFQYQLGKDKLEKDPYLEYSRTKKLKNFRPSGIAFHPNGNLYITSAKNESILVFDRGLEKIDYFKLPKNQYPQVEGIAIHQDGQLYLTSEKAEMSCAKLYIINSE